MRKMMFLALVLSVMAIGSVSANDADRRPNGVMLGVSGKAGFVMVGVGNPRGANRPGEYRGGCDDCCDKKHRKDDHRGCKHHGKCKDKRHNRGGKPHHPGMHPKPHRPGAPLPPPRHK